MYPQIMGSIDIPVDDIFNGKIKVVDSTANMIVSEIMSRTVVTVEQSYQLKENKTGQKFGRNGEEVFNRNFAVGFIVNNCLLLPNHAVLSWLYDKDFEKYKDGYCPTNICNKYIVNNDTSEYVSMCLDSIIVANKDSATFFYKSTEAFPRGLSIDIGSHNKNGWLVWVLAENVSQKPPKILFDITYYSDIPKETSLKQLETDSKVSILGCAIISPSYEEIGKVSFSLSAIGVRVDKVKWKLYAPKQLKPSDDVKKNDQLTPIGNSDKTGKKDKKKKQKK